MDQRDPGMLGPAEAKLQIPEVAICGIDRKIAVFEPRNLVIATVRRPLVPQ